MEVFLALVACADHEHQFGRSDVEAQDMARCAERNDEFAQRRSGTDLAVAVGPVSYTHLDVYKRQHQGQPATDARRISWGQRLASSPGLLQRLSLIHI